MNYMKSLNKPTMILMLIGFVISFTCVMIGISSLNTIMESLRTSESQDTPLYSVMENSGMSLALELYVFSIANCFVVTNYWIITKQREMAIRKAFGWTNRQLILLIVTEMSKILTLGLFVSLVMTGIVKAFGVKYFSIHLTPMFVAETALMFVITLIVASVIPSIRILKVRPAEVVS